MEQQFADARYEADDAGIGARDGMCPANSVNQVGTRTVHSNRPTMGSVYFRFPGLLFLLPDTGETGTADGAAKSGITLSFNVRNTKLDLLCRMPGIRYSRSRNSRS